MSLALIDNRLFVISTAKEAKILFTRARYPGVKPFMSSIIYLRLRGRTLSTSIDKSNRSRKE